MTGMPWWVRLILVVLSIGFCFIGIAVAVGFGTVRELWRELLKDLRSNKL
jgi:hypothetical protein